MKQSLKEKCYFKQTTQKVSDKNQQKVKETEKVSKQKHARVKTRIWTSSFIEHNKDLFIDHASHYLYNVMRHGVGDIIKVFNFFSGEWLATIVSITKKSCVVLPNTNVRLANQCISNLFIRNEQILIPISLHLIFAPFKAFSPSFVIQKATELSVHRITPILSEYSVIRNVSIEKLSSVAIEATEQCERINIPVINDMVNFSEIFSKSFSQNSCKIDKEKTNQLSVDSVNNSFHSIIVCESRLKGYQPYELAEIILEQYKVILKENIIIKPDKTTITASPTLSLSYVIGPEGGFSDREIAFLQNQQQQMQNIYFLNLGDLIMRSETAFIAAISALKTAFRIW